MNQCPQSFTISLFLDSELEREEMRRFATHLETCPICSQELRDLQDYRKNLSSVQVDPEAKERVFHRIEPRLAFWRRRDLVIPRALAASFVMTLALSLVANVYLGLNQAGKISQIADTPAKANVLEVKLVVPEPNEPQFQLPSDAGFRLLEKPVIRVADRSAGQELRR